MSASSQTVSRLLTHLVEKGQVEWRGREVVLAGTPPAEAFKKLYFNHRASPLHKILSLQRVELLAKLDRTPRSLEALAMETGIPSDTLYGYLKGFLWLGVVSRSKQGRAYCYSFNFILWSELKDFVTSLQEYQVLRLVPREALLIKSYGDSVLFKSTRPQDATFSSFSAYEDYGIELGLRDNYYTMPKRELSIQEVFIHSLDSAWESSQKLFCILFYLNLTRSPGRKRSTSGSSKDIDVVCRSEEDKERLLASARALGFQIVGPEKRHERLGVNRLAVKGGRNLDIFAGRISYDFCLSEAMWQRAIRTRSFGSLTVRDASIEDIFVMKLIANRPGDAPDCSALVIAGLDFDAVYREIEAQYRNAGEVEQKIWITYIEEGIARLITT